MSRRHAEIWSHPGPLLVDPYTWPWSPNGHISPWKFKCQGHGQGQTHWSHVRPGVQSICLLLVSWQSDHFWLRSSKFNIWPWKFKVKVMAKVKTDGHIWGLELNRYVCFSLHGNQSIFGGDIANSIFDLENWRSRSWPRSNPTVTFEALRSTNMFAFCFVAIKSFLTRDTANSIFDLENLRSRSWPRSNLMFKFEALTSIDMLAFFVSLQLDHFWLRYSQFHIWPSKFKVKVTMKIDQNLIR